MTKAIDRSVSILWDRTTYFTDIVVDEAHHCLSDSYQRVLAHFPDANILGVTATPDRGDMKNLGQFFDSKAYEYTMTQAIQEKYLCPVKAQMIPLELDISNLKISNGDFSTSDLGNALAPYLDQIAREMSHYCEGRKTVVFLPLVHISKRFCEILNSYGMRAAEVNGNSDDRAEILRDFENGRYDILCNSMLLTEGWDCPAVDCVVVLRPTKVRSLYQQMVGRGMRLYPGKDHLLLLDFLWLSERHDLCRPSSLVSKDSEIAQKIDKQMVDSNESVDLLEAEEKAERDVLAEREEALAKELAEMRKRKRKLVDPIQYALSIAAEDLVGYVPTFAWEMAPPSAKQIEFLERRGIFAETVENMGKASLLIDRLVRRQDAGLSTPKQIRCLERYGFRQVGTWQFDDAAKMVGFMELAEERVFSNMSAEHLDDLFGAFSDCIPEPMPEMSLVSSAYNTLRKNLKLVSGLLKDMDWYTEINRDELLNAMINCSVLPKVQETVVAIRETITELQERGCTVFEADGVCYSFTEHLDMLDQMLSCFVYPNGEMATVYLIDTCVFLHSPDILSYFREDELIRIPFTVLRELDYHKDNNSDYSLKKNAAYACKQIEKKTEEAKLRGDDHFGVEPRDYPEMLPDGFSKHKHDDLILSAALRYKLLDPRILTDDTNFRNIARTQGINPIAWDKFVTGRGGVAIRGQAKSLADTAVVENNDKSIIVEVVPEPYTSLADEDKDVVSESQTDMTVEKLYGMPLLYAVKKFGLNAKELSLLLSHKLKTCGDLAKADEMEIKGFYKKKKTFMANHLLEVRKKIHAEADKLSRLAEDTVV